MGGLCANCCSLIIPPIGVWMARGCGGALCLNILLTCLGYFPGLIHACCIINANPHHHH